MKSEVRWLVTTSISLLAMGASGFKCDQVEVQCRDIALSVVPGDTASLDVLPCLYDNRTGWDPKADELARFAFVGIPDWLSYSFEACELQPADCRPGLVFKASDDAPITSPSNGPATFSYTYTDPIKLPFGAGATITVAVRPSDSHQLTIESEGVGKVLVVRNGVPLDPVTPPWSAPIESDHPGVQVTAQEIDRFLRWEGDCQSLNKTTTVIVDQDRTCKVVFEKRDVEHRDPVDTYIYVHGAGVVYANGEEVTSNPVTLDTVTARLVTMPAEGNVVTRWVGACQADVEDISIATMSVSDGAVCEVYFEPAHTLTVYREGPADLRRTITMPGRTGICVEGGSCTFTVPAGECAVAAPIVEDTPAAQVEWGGACVATIGPSTTVNVSGDTTCTAKFIAPSACEPGLVEPTITVRQGANELFPTNGVYTAVVCQSRNCPVIISASFPDDRNMESCVWSDGTNPDIQDSTINWQPPVIPSDGEDAVVYTVAIHDSCGYDTVAEIHIQTTY
ncbi:MAG: hypothetical protein H6716_29305 [Polyangiaceae bacterium]|nr:hypothetical protein [Polyangiaceae bacterium]